LTNVVGLPVALTNVVGLSVTLTNEACEGTWLSNGDGAAVVGFKLTVTISEGTSEGTVVGVAVTVGEKLGKISELGLCDDVGG
jgi:hypothetical protein